MVIEIIRKGAKKSNIKHRKIVATLFDYRHRFEYRWKANVDIANKLSLPKANCVNLCTLNSLQIWRLADIEMQIKPNTGRNIKPNKQTQPTKKASDPKINKSPQLKSKRGFCRHRIHRMRVKFWLQVWGDNTYVWWFISEYNSGLFGDYRHHQS